MSCEGHIARKHLNQNGGRIDQKPHTVRPFVLVEMGWLTAKNCHLEHYQMFSVC